MKKIALPALLLIAGVAFGGYVHAQPIYRCGSTYSQFPCTGAVSVDMSDARAPEQKAQTQAATLTTAKIANAMEQGRLAEEKRLLAINQSSSEKPKRVNARPKKTSANDAEIPAIKTKKTPEKKSAKKVKKPA
jgi:hypothetical protein